MNQDNARIELQARGASFERKEDRWGETHTGWWLDDVFLGSTPKDALEALLG